MQGCGGKEVPQRQGNAEIAAVVEGDWGGNAVQEAHSKDAAEKPFHNGREMRKLLPLWKVAGETMPSRKPIARMRRKSHSATAGKCGNCCRCGRRTEGMREGEENSAETPDHCHLGAKRLSPPKGKVWKGVKKGRLCRPSPSFRRKAPALIAPGPFCGKRGIRTPGTHKEFNSFRDCPVRPLRHLS